MEMYSASDLKKGLKIEIDGYPWVITDFDFCKPGKGTALYRCKLKNLMTGASMDRTFRPVDKVGKPDLEEREMHFIYDEGDNCVFSDSETYDEVRIPKEILGNKKNMIRWQDDFYACMAERWPELERGAPAVETKRKHLTPQWYKKVTAMDAKLERLETALNDINMFNAGKKREEAVALLAQLLPEVESFQAEIQRMQQAMTQSLSMQRCSAEENETLKSELTAERRKSAEQRAKLTALEERYKRAEKLLDGVPKELLKQQMDSRQER